MHTQLGLDAVVWHRQIPSPNRREKILKHVATKTLDVKQELAEDPETDRTWFWEYPHKLQTLSIKS